MPLLPRWVRRALIRCCSGRRFTALLHDRHVICGFVIAQHPSLLRDEPEFSRHVERALRALCRHDPRRFMRARRVLNVIYNGPSYGGAAYVANARACELDFSKFSEAWIVDEGFPSLIAAAIVHEATHGHIRRRRQPRNIEDQIREEAVCHREEWRCFERITTACGIEYDEAWLEEVRRFDGRWHRVYWGQTPFRSARRRLRRFMNRCRRRAP